jgi:hypothetical protein
METQIMEQKTADMAAAGSGFLAGSAWIANVEPFITVAAGVVAIVAGAFAAWYHFERAAKMRASRLDKKD